MLLLLLFIVVLTYDCGGDDYDDDLMKMVRRPSAAQMFQMFSLELRVMLMDLLAESVVCVWCGTGLCVCGVHAWIMCWIHLLFIARGGMEGSACWNRWVIGVSCTSFWLLMDDPVFCRFLFFLGDGVGWTFGSFFFFFNPCPQIDFMS